MTVQEARYKYGVLQTTASVGDTLTSIVRRIYSSDDDIYIKVLKSLNNRLDWQCVEPGAVILYFSLSVIKQIEEV